MDKFITKKTNYTDTTFKISKIPLKKSDILYVENFLNDKLSTELFNYLDNLSQWETKEIILYGKKCHQNRETIFFSYKGLNYRYSGTENIGIDLLQHPILINIIDKI